MPYGVSQKRISYGFNHVMLFTFWLNTNNSLTYSTLTNTKVHTLGIYMLGVYINTVGIP